MNSRRQFIQKTIKFFAITGTLLNPITSAVKTVYAETKRILVPRGTDMKSLISDSYSEKVDRFPIEDVRSNKVFLTYQVNGKVLPQKHGFPLRVAAEDYYGSSWTKYVHTVEAEIIT